MNRLRDQLTDDDAIALSDSEERYDHQLLEEDEDEDEGDGYNQFNFYPETRHGGQFKPNKIVEHLRRASSHLTDRSRKRIARRLVQGKSAWRRVVTGDKDKRIR